MKKLLFVTTNPVKFALGSSAVHPQGIELVQREYNIDEIQSENTEQIAKDKAKKAYELAGEPLVVTDDCWSILGLNGFPGPYMKSMNHWLTVENFLHLTSPLTDRRIVLIQQLVYTDGIDTVLFQETIPGIVLRQPQGTSDIPWLLLASLEGDNGRSIAEIYETSSDHQDRTAAKVWHDFAKWFNRCVPQ